MVRTSKSDVFKDEGVFFRLIMNSRAFKTSSIVMIHECSIYLPDVQEIDDSCILKKNIWCKYHVHLTNPIIAATLGPPFCTGSRGDVFVVRISKPVENL